MKTINSSKLIVCDVDETLLSPSNWGYTTLNADYVQSGDVKFYIHHRHLTLLKEFKARGFTIILWSAGGAKWAEWTAKELQLEDIVDFVMDKPSWYIDDKSAEKFMGEQIFLDLNNPTKDLR